jgi:carboxyl-terminal processing protease
MHRIRTVFLTVSLVSVLLFSGLLMAGRQSQDHLFRALGNLAEVVHLVQTEYVDDIDPRALADSLEAGIVESVDYWAAVIPEEQVELYREMLSKPPAFGLVLGTRLGSAAVRQVLHGSPAAETDLAQWEVIEKVNGVYTRGRPLWQIRLELERGERDEAAVTLTVVDREVDDRREVVLEPAQWLPEAVTSTELDSARVVRVDSLPKGAGREVAAAVRGASHLVLDLRDLSWGLEEEALAVADAFVAQGVLGSWRGRQAGEREFAATAGGVDAQTLVLVGPGTEGVGEILASALQRSGATLIGRKTMGHAPHMQFVHEDGIHLYIPVALWLRSDDTAISDNGIEPAEVVENDDEADDAADAVLDRALALLEPAA